MGDNDPPEKTPALDPDEEREVARKYRNEDVSQSELADEYGVSQSTISRICRMFEHGRGAGIEQAEEAIMESDRVNLQVEDDLDDTDDDVGETHTHEKCGTEVEYGTETCPECGDKLAWGAIE